MGNEVGKKRRRRREGGCKEASMLLFLFFFCCCYCSRLSISFHCLCESGISNQILFDLVHSPPLSLHAPLLSTDIITHTKLTNSSTISFPFFQVCQPPPRTINYSIHPHLQLPNFCSKFSRDKVRSSPTSLSPHKTLAFSSLSLSLSLLRLLGLSTPILPSLPNSIYW